MNELTNLSYKEKKTRYVRLVGQLQLLDEILELDSFIDLKTLGEK